MQNTGNNSLLSDEEVSVSGNSLLSDEVVDITVKKKEPTESTSTDSSAPVKQESTPLEKNTEPIDLPASYQNDRTNKKDLVSGGSYKLLRGGKPVTGTWDAQADKFIMPPLLDYSVKPKEQGFIESALPYPLNTPKPESEETTLGRVATDVDNIQKEAADKFVAAQYISSFAPIQRLQILEQEYQNKPTEQLKKNIDELKSKKLSDEDFQGVRFEGDKNVYQGVLPAPKVGEQLVPFEGKLPKLPKTDMTVGEAYNEMQDNKDYVEQAVGEVQGFNSFVNDALVKKLPQDKQEYLSSLVGSPLYQEELIKSLEQSNQSDNVAIAYLKGLEHSLSGIYEAGSTVGLDENQVYEKMLTDYNKDKLFGYKPQTFGTEIAHSLGGLTPDVAAGAVNPALFIASFGSRMPEEQLKNYYFDKIEKGEKPDFNEAWKYATTSTALQGALLFGAGAVGGAGKQIIGETFGKRAAEILTETAKRAGKDALAFGAGGTYLQNKVNQVYGVTQNNDYLKSMVDMGVIGAALGLVHLSPQALKGRVSEKTKNEVTDMAAFMPPAYVSKLLKDGVETGRITDSESDAIEARMNVVRRIAAELPKELSLDEINELVPLYEAKDALLAKQKDASPTIKDVLKGQIADLDQKILVKAAIPLSAEEKAERASLIKKEVTREGDIDKLRLKQLNARHEAVKEGKEQEKANEIANELGYDHAKHLLNDLKKQGLGEFETVQEVPKETLEELSAKQQQKLEANKKLSELMPELGGEKEVEAEIKNEPTEEELAKIPDVEEDELIANKANKKIGVDVFVAIKPIEIAGDKYKLSQIRENNNENTFIVENSKGEEIGRAQLSADGNYVENIRIDAKYRRKGIASKMYDFIESRKGIELSPSPIKQSKEAKGLWEKRNTQKAVSKNANGGLLAKALKDAIDETFGGFKQETKPNLFDQISEAKRSKKTSKGKQEAMEKAMEEHGEQGKRAIEIETNFKSLVERLKSMTDENGEPLLKVKC